MIAPVFYVLTFISVSTQATPIGHGTPIKFDVTTQYHDGVIPNAFNLRCTPQGRGTCAKIIMSIRVSKNEDTVIASIQGGSISYGRLMKSSVKAEGHIDTDMSKTFLSVTINDAVREDSGLYTCTVVYLDESLHVKYDTASDNVTITNQDTQDIIKHLMSKISFLENLVKFQQDELSNVKTSLVDQGIRHQSHAKETHETDLDLKSSVAYLMEKVAALEAELTVQKNNHITDLEEQKNDCNAKISQLTNRVGVQEQGLMYLIEKENTSVSFIALHTRAGVFKNGADFVYSNVIENSGDAYDGNTGVFTAPVSGDYLLYLSVSTYAGKWIDLDLKSSKGQILTRVQAYDKDYYDYSDSSCVARLQTGERVWPNIRVVSAGFTIWGRDTPDNLVKFYGYLLKTL